MTILQQLLVIAAVVAIGVGAWLLLRPEAFSEAARTALPPSKYDQHILSLERLAADAAYQQQIMQLYLVWLKDPAGQPKRATDGALRARKAYIDVMTAIEQNEQLLAPSPP